MWLADVLRRAADLLESPARIEAKLDEGVALLREVIGRQAQMANELDVLEQEVAKTTSLEDGAITLMKGLADQIAASKTDPARLQKLSDGLHAKAVAMAQALADNTPASGGGGGGGGAPPAPAGGQPGAAAKKKHP
jgi:hypothetical protein